MSEQRRVRAEIKQGMHQYLMHMYMSYLQSHNEDEAKALVQEVLQEELQHFNLESVSATSAKEELLSKVSELKSKLEKASDYDSQMYYAEQIDALESSIEILTLKE